MPKTSSRKSKFQTKYLSMSISDETSDIADLKFNNLVVGRKYRITGQVTLLTDDTAAHNSTFRVLHNGIIIGRAFLRYPINQGGTLQTTYGLVSRPFVATTTSTVAAWSEFGSSSLSGDGTATFTFLTIEELPNHEETTDFT